jgi:glycosyltransferase involved in cell wall biosynthesis
LKKISIITPSFNQGQFIEQTIDSVLSQNYNNLEYIIIDGGSKDNSVEIIKKYQKYLHYWVSEKDNGQSDAINKGLKLATGDIFNWLNSDDYYEPSTFKKINEYFTPDDVLVVSGRNNILKDNLIVRISSGLYLYNSLEKTIGNAKIDQPGTFFRKDAIDKMGLLNPSLHFIMDREWWIRYLLLFGLNGIKKVDDVFVNFRIHDNSKTHNFQKSFVREGLNVYYTIAHIYNIPEALQFERHFEVSLIADIIKLTNIPTPIVRKSLHYFWLHQGNISYAHDDYKTAALFLSLINVEFLQKEDAQLYFSLKNRIKFLPPFLKKLINRIR